jgi:segregation and condensation protein A
MEQDSNGNSIVSGGSINKGNAKPAATEAVQLFPSDKPAKFDSNDQLMKVLFDKEDITWQTVLYELINSHQMDPWDIDISLISAKFIEIIQAMKEMDLRIPAKMILAAAILLRIKSNKLVGEDLDALDQLIASSEEDEIQGLFDEDVDPKIRLLDIPELIPKTPQPRKRKVSIYDLVYALEKALEVKHRRVVARMPDTDIILPHKHNDISVIIKNMYLRIINFFSAHNTPKVTFHALVPPNSSKEDKIFSFIPLMFLDHQRRVYIRQDKAFGEIDIYLRNEELIAQFEQEYEKEQEEIMKKKKEKARSKGKGVDALKGDAKKLKQARLGKGHRKEQVEHGEKVAKEHEKEEELKEIYEDKDLGEGVENTHLPIAGKDLGEEAVENMPLPIAEGEQGEGGIENIHSASAENELGEEIGEEFKEEQDVDLKK